jgi:hypothetical protein
MLVAAKLSGASCNRSRCRMALSAKGSLVQFQLKHALPVSAAAAAAASEQSKLMPLSTARSCQFADGFTNGRSVWKQCDRTGLWRLLLH